MFDPADALSIGDWTMNRVTHKTVVFQRPFVLDHTEGEFPPGAYMIETEEELLDTISFPAYRRLSTVMQFAEANGIISCIRIDPIALDLALARDARID